MRQFYEAKAKASRVPSSPSKNLMYQENVHTFEMAFEQQDHFGVYCAWVKLPEQEIRNTRWIANMVIQNTKDPKGSVESL